MNGGMRVAAYEKSKSVKLKSISTMTEGTIWRQILLFSIPLILGNLLQQMYNTVDSIIVGNFAGSNAQAAVGSSTSLICLLIAFSMGASERPSIYTIFGIRMPGGRLCRRESVRFPGSEGGRSL